MTNPATRKPLQDLEHMPGQSRFLPFQQNWLVVALMSMMLAMSLLDRLILSILANPVSLTLNLSDGQLGLLMGTSFAVLYSLAGLPLAHCIDTYNRKRLVVLGVTLWSAMTIVSGFATDFTQLLFARSGVAIGEAVLTPAAVSLIADLFRKEKRALPMTIYTSIGGLMATVSFLVGGLVLDLASEVTNPGFEAWRLTFVMVGCPGLLLALIFSFLVGEPARATHESAPNEKVSFPAFINYLVKYWWFYLPLLASGGVLNLFNSSLFSWLPTIMVRAHGFEPSDAGLVFGAVITPIQLTAIFLWPRLAMRIERRRRYEGVPGGLLIASIVSLPFIILGPLMTDTNYFIGGIGMAILAPAAWAILPVIGFQLFCPNRMRGRLAALNLFVMNIVGYGLGPILTVYLGEAWGETIILDSWGLSANPLARGLASTGLIATPIMIMCTYVCLKTAKRLPVVENV